MNYSLDIEFVRSTFSNPYFVNLSGTGKNTGSWVIHVQFRGFGQSLIDFGELSDVQRDTIRTPFQFNHITIKIWAQFSDCDSFNRLYSSVPNYAKNILLIFQSLTQENQLSKSQSNLEPICHLAKSLIGPYLLPSLKWKFKQNWLD